MMLIGGCPGSAVEPDEDVVASFFLYLGIDFLESLMLFLKTKIFFAICQETSDVDIMGVAKISEISRSRSQSIFKLHLTKFFHYFSPNLSKLYLHLSSLEESKIKR